MEVSTAVAGGSTLSRRAERPRFFSPEKVSVTTPYPCRRFAMTFSCT
jgi:hypothetical protein